jgi:hypothetical protein
MNTFSSLLVEFEVQMTNLRLPLLTMFLLGEYKRLLTSASTQTIPPNLDSSGMGSIAYVNSSAQKNLDRTEVACPICVFQSLIKEQKKFASAQLSPMRATSPIATTATPLISMKRVSEYGR